MNSEDLKQLLEWSHQTLHVNLEGLVHTDSLVRPQPGGNSLNWVLGHIVATRNSLLALIPHDRVMPEAQAELFQRGSSDVADEQAIPIGELIELFDRSQQTLLAEIDRLAESLTGKAALFLFHETYHVGQVALLRRLAGKEGAIK